jgi:two-component system sensor histidine kinase KdpD
MALTMLLLVLGIATKWGLAEAIFTSVLAMLGFNYFFLPPIGTFTIQDAQNWVALCAFLITAVIASQLSARVKRRAEEASARRNEIERLYSLSRAMLMDETTDVLRTALLSAGEIFGLSHLAFHDLNSGRVYGSTDVPHLTPPELAEVAASGEPNIGAGFAVIPVRLGTRILGSLGLHGPDLTPAERDSIANLIAINFERAKALDRATEAEAARRGERLKTFLLDGIAHDLKTPLTAIKTCVTTLLTIPPRTDDKRTELLSIIDEETDRLQHTITEAIQLARIESGKVSLDRQSVRVREIVTRVLAKAGTEGPYSVSVPEDTVISADSDLVEQALKQLVENARKYSSPAAPVEVRAKVVDGLVSVQVLDRGQGVSANELERIFEKFYRSTRARTSVEGTGIGLAVAKGIIEAHGGRIWAENRPGGGSIFSFTLPLEAR